MQLLLDAWTVEQLTTSPSSDEGVPNFESLDFRSSDLSVSLSRLVRAIEGVEFELRRIANHFDPPPPDKVGTPYVADRLGCTTVRITQMIRSGEIPAICVVPGTGNGKPWKFFRVRIEDWLENR